MQNLSSIGYLEFLRGCSRGSVEIRVHRQLAERVMASRLMPRDYKFAFRLWTLIWLSLVPVAVAVGLLYSWWWIPVLASLLALAQTFTRTRTASMFIVDYAKEDELFYDIMVTLGVMRVCDRDSGPSKRLIAA